MKSHQIFVVLSFVIFSLSACTDELSVEKQKILDRDLRNSKVQFSLSSNRDDLKYCISDIALDAGPMDVFRVLLHAADTLKYRDFNRVLLCFRNETRFILDGDDFKVIGEELDTQNPMYTVRTFPEKLTLPNGKEAYPKHQGGALYLIRVQMEDFQDMNGRWFLNELSAEKRMEYDKKRPKVFASEEEVF